MMRKIFFLIMTISFVYYYKAQNNTGVSDFDLVKSEDKKINDDATSSLDESIKIPIYIINTGKISYPIFLTYDMSGIPVDRVSSDVGLGWELSNSFIQREVRDKVDINEDKYIKYPTWSATGYENISNTFITTLNALYPYNRKGYQKVKTNNIRESYNSNFNTGQLDHEPDLFHVQSYLLGTTFFYPNSLQEAVELNHKNSIITQEIGETLIDYTTKKGNLLGGGDNMSWNKVFDEYKKFFIKKDDGILMTFENPEFVHNMTFYQAGSSMNSDYSNSNGPAADFYNSPNAEKWFISKISDIQSQRDIIFEYETYSTEDNHNDDQEIFAQNNKPYLRGGVWQVDNYLKYSTGIGCYINYDEDGHDYPFKGYTQMYTRYLKKKRIKTIKFDSGKVEFFYDKNREDFHNGKALTRIEIKNKENRLINSFNFEYGYFESEQYRNEFSKRLKLLSVTQLDGLKQTFEYYEDNKMPQIGSYNKDFYGYCNTSNDDFINPLDLKNKSYPIYYYYPDKYEYSIMPYNILGEKNFSLGGIINKEPNELARTWSLKKIKYSTGGFIQYNLETNTFNLWGKNLKGNGVRIASKIIAESEVDTSPRVINYSYNLPNGNSSGTIYNFPLAGYPTKKLFTSYVDDYGVLNSSAASYNGEPDLIKNFLLFQVLTKGNTQIKYSEIKKSEGEKATVFNFKTVFDSTNRYFRDFYSDNKINLFKSHCISEFLYTNSGVGHDDKKFIFHYPTTTKMYKNNDIISETSYLYNNFIERQSDNVLLLSPDLSFFKSENIRTANIAFDKTYGVYDFKNLMLSDKKIFTTDNYLVQKKQKNYYKSGNKELTTNYFYYPVISTSAPILSGTSTSDGFGNNYGVQYIYPDERYQALINEHILNRPIGKIINKNNNEISNTIDYYSSDSIYPSKTIKISPNQNTKELVNYELYDNRGNLISFIDNNGIYNTILYGYNQMYPIAIIKGTGYSGLMQELGMQSDDPSEYLNLEIVRKSNLDIDEASENNFLAELDSFRKTVASRKTTHEVTTFSYDNLIGVTSVTNPNGMRVRYAYDSVTNKLIKVIDKDGNILQEYKFNNKH